MSQTYTIVDRHDHYDTITFDDIPLSTEGTEGDVYLSLDQRHVVKIYKIDKNEKILRLILGAYPDPEFEHCMAWITHLVLDELGKVLGVVMPNALRDSPVRQLKWYRSYKVWSRMPRSERGNFVGRVKAGIALSTAMRYLTRLGYAHADLSLNNFFLNPITGRGVVIDLDGLVVPDYFEGEILGTKGYMAPELVTRQLKRPNYLSDRFALAVCLYELLLMGHPLLEGGRPSLSDDPDEDDKLRMGKEALYREHPTDNRNHPQPGNVYFSAAWLGDDLMKLFQRTFIDGLHHPDRRPHPDEYEEALTWLLNDLVECEPERDCWWGSFSVHNTACPVCGSPAPKPIVGHIQILDNTQPGFYSVSTAKVSEMIKDQVVTRGTIFGAVAEADIPCLSVKLQRNGSWQVELQDAGVQGVLLLPDEWQMNEFQVGKTYVIPAEGKLILHHSDRNKLVEFARSSGR